MVVSLWLSQNVIRKIKNIQKKHWEYFYFFFFLVKISRLESYHSYFFRWKKSGNFNMNVLWIFLKISEKLGKYSASQHGKILYILLNIFCKNRTTLVRYWKLRRHLSHCLLIDKSKINGSQYLIHDFLNQVSILFGFRKKVAKENLIIRWSRKKRDHVDELLVREAQEEEHEWTNYEFDEITVKNQVTVALLNNLLNNTTAALSKAFKTKLEKLEQQENSQSVNWGKLIRSVIVRALFVW